MQLALYLEHGEQFSRAAQQLPMYTAVDIDSILLDCFLEVLPIAASRDMGPDHLAGIEFPHPEIRVVFKLKDRPLVAAVYSIDVFVTDAASNPLPAKSPSRKSATWFPVARASAKVYWPRKLSARSRKSDHFL